MMVGIEFRVYVEGYGSIVQNKEQKRDWGNRFYMTMNPVRRRKPYLFQELPSSLRNSFELYYLELKRLAMEILGFMGKAVEIDIKEIEKLFEDGMVESCPFCKLFIHLVIICSTVNNSGRRNSSAVLTDSSPYGRLRDPAPIGFQPTSSVGVTHGLGRHTTLSQSMDHLGLSHNLDHPSSPRSLAAQGILCIDCLKRSR